MFIENPTNRIPVTNSIKELIISEREKINLSATQLAKNMERPQSWIAQIENGRTKTIKQEDLVFIFASILNLSNEEADIFLMDKLGVIESIEENSNAVIDKHKLKQVQKFTKFIDRKTETEFKQQKKFIISAFNDFYEEMPDEAVKILRTYCSSIKYNFPFILGIMAIPFAVFSDLKDDVAREFHEELSNLFLKYANKDEHRVSRISKDDVSESEEDEYV